MLLMLCQVCPVCAVLPSGDPNHMTDDLAAHIALVHRLTTSDFISFLSLMYLTVLALLLHGCDWFCSNIEVGVTVMWSLRFIYCIFVKMLRF